MLETRGSCAFLKVGKWVGKSITFIFSAGSGAEYSSCEIPDTLQGKEECEQPSLEKALPKISQAGHQRSRQ